jgi:sulfite reductase beta subunit-like hemoprotein
MMIRSSVPGGRVTPEAYLAHDDIAQRTDVQDMLATLVAELRAKTGAYHEIWLDGERVEGEEEEEPVYGPSHLPRKFKIGIALLRPLLAAFAAERRDGEGFGDWCHGIGVGRLQECFQAGAA